MSILWLKAMHNADDQSWLFQVTGNLEVKKVLCTHGGGITVSSKWNTDNILNTTLDVEVSFDLVKVLVVEMCSKK